MWNSAQNVCAIRHYKRYDWNKRYRWENFRRFVFHAVRRCRYKCKVCMCSYTKSVYLGSSGASSPSVQWRKKNQNCIENWKTLKYTAKGDIVKFIVTMTILHYYSIYINLHPTATDSWILLQHSSILNIFCDIQKKSYNIVVEYRKIEIILRFAMFFYLHRRNTQPTVTTMALYNAYNNNTQTTFVR